VTRAGWSLAHDPEDPVGALRTRHRAEELTLDARTARPLWYGERLDLGYAIDVLRPPPAPPPTTPAQDG
jgi:hypothetical protein